MNNIFLRKATQFVLAFLFANSIYSQSACSGAYTFSVSGSSTTCSYTFTASVPHTPTVTSIQWRVYSTGTYGSLCYTGSGSPWTQQFCFDGDYDITMIVNFSGGSWCYVTHTNESISCNDAVVCNPDPERNETVPDPLVEITYIEPVICALDQLSPVSGCMYV